MTNLRRSLPAVVLVVVCTAVVGATSSMEEGRYTLALTGGLLLAAAAFAVPQVVLIVALVGAIAVWRVPIGGDAISYADVLSVFGTLVALLFVPRRGDRLLLRVLWAYAVYAGLLAIAVMAEPSANARLEWLHRLALFPGPLLIGAAIVRLDAVRLALRTFLVALAALAAYSAFISLRAGLAPAFPYGIHKNAAGLLFTFAILVTFTAAHRLNWSSGTVLAVRGVLLLGLLGTQSRGAIGALAVALAVRALLRMPGEDRRRPAVVGAAIVGLVLMGLAAMSVAYRDLSDFASPDNAVDTRLAVYTTALDMVGESPWTGLGLRFFESEAVGPLGADGLPTGIGGSPHNLVIAELAEGGLLATAGLLVLLWVTWRALRRCRGDLAAMGTAVLVAEVVASMFDVYWVAGRVSCALVLVGMALATEPRPDDDAEARPDVGDVVARPSPLRSVRSVRSLAAGRVRPVAAPAPVGRAR